MDILGRPLYIANDLTAGCRECGTMKDKDSRQLVDGGSSSTAVSMSDDNINGVTDGRLMPSTRGTEGNYPTIRAGISRRSGASSRQSAKDGRIWLSFKSPTETAELGFRFVSSAVGN